MHPKVVISSDNKSRKALYRLLLKINCETYREIFANVGNWFQFIKGFPLSITSRVCGAIPSVLFPLQITELNVSVDPHSFDINICKRSFEKMPLTVTHCCFLAPLTAEVCTLCIEYLTEFNSEHTFRTKGEIDMDVWMQVTKIAMSSSASKISMNSTKQYSIKKCSLSILDMALLSDFQFLGEVISASTFQYWESSILHR